MLLSGGHLIPNGVQKPLIVEGEKYVNKYIVHFFYLPTLFIVSLEPAFGVFSQIFWLIPTTTIFNLLYLISGKYCILRGRYNSTKAQVPTNPRPRDKNLVTWHLLITELMFADLTDTNFSDRFSLQAWFGSFWLYGTSTIVGYLMSNTILYI